MGGATGLPRFEVAARLRPVDLVSPGSVLVDDAAPGPASAHPTPHPAPYAAAEVELLASGTAPDHDAPVRLALVSGDDELGALWDPATGEVSLELRVGSTTSRHLSRRHGRPEQRPVRLGLTLTGVHLAVHTHDGRAWTTRARVDLGAERAADRGGAGRVDTRDERWLAALVTTRSGPVARVRAGGFGQLGLRDLRLVTRADGSAYRPGGDLLLTATSAGPGFFDTAHTSVWSLDPVTLSLTHRSDLFFRRPDRPGAFGDHATHLVRDGEHWLVATSTWGDFDRRRDDASVAVTLARPGGDVDLLAGRHLLDTEPLPLPVDGLRAAGVRSVGVWDPHLVRDGDDWLVGFVSARRFFDFHPALATGPALDALTLRAVSARRRATEGTTLLRVDGAWRVLVSDGRDGRRGQSQQHAVLDLDLAEVGVLDAPYPTNIPWPTLVDLGEEGWLMVAFDGTPYAGPLPGYGTHGRVVVARSVAGT